MAPYCGDIVFEYYAVNEDFTELEITNSNSDLFGVVNYGAKTELLVQTEDLKYEKDYVIKVKAYLAKYPSLMIATMPEMTI